MEGNDDGCMSTTFILKTDKLPCTSLNEGPFSTTMCNRHNVTEPNDYVAPIFPMAKPVMPTAPAGLKTWLTAPSHKPNTLQQPLSDGLLRIVPKTEIIAA